MKHEQKPRVVTNLSKIWVSQATSRSCKKPTMDSQELRAYNEEMERKLAGNFTTDERYLLGLF